MLFLVKTPKDFKILFKSTEKVQGSKRIIADLEPNKIANIYCLVKGHFVNDFKSWETEYWVRSFEEIIRSKLLWSVSCDSI